MWFSVPQALADPNGAPGTPKATFDAAISNLEPLPLHLITQLGHLWEDQARLEMQPRKLQAQVTPPCYPTLALGHRTPELTPGSIPGSAKPQPHSL